MADKKNRRLEDLFTIRTCLDCIHYDLCGNLEKTDECKQKMSTSELSFEIAIRPF